MKSQFRDVRDEVLRPLSMSSTDPADSPADATQPPREITPRQLADPIADDNTRAQLRAPRHVPVAFAATPSWARKTEHLRWQAIKEYVAERSGRRPRTGAPQ